MTASVIQQTTLELNIAGLLRFHELIDHLRRFAPRIRLGLNMADSFRTRPVNICCITNCYHNKKITRFRHRATWSLRQKSRSSESYFCTYLGKRPKYDYCITTCSNERQLNKYLCKCFVLQASKMIGSDVDLFVFLSFWKVD